MSAPVTNPPANPTNGNGNGGNNQASGSQNSQVSNTNQQSSTSRLIIPPSAPAGLVIITQPPETATSYYKIAPSNTITFGWNFTYVLATPTHLTVSAIADNGNTYPVGPTDGIIPGTATEVTWDIYSYQQANPNTPLAQATYTLSIWDDRGSTAIRQAGWLTPNNNLRFALYNPSSYTPLASGWSCVECSGSWARYTAHPAFAGIVATCIIMFLSGFTLFRRRWN